jgi:hypothetical protein
LPFFFVAVVVGAGAAGADGAGDAGGFFACPAEDAPAEGPRSCRGSARDADVWYDAAAAVTGRSGRRSELLRAARKEEEEEEEEEGSAPCGALAVVPDTSRGEEGEGERAEEVRRRK